MAEKRVQAEIAAAGDPDRLTQIDDNALYMEVAPRKRGHVYGLGNTVQFDHPAAPFDPTLRTSQLEQTVTRLTQELRDKDAAHQDRLTRLEAALRAAGINIDLDGSAPPPPQPTAHHTAESSHRPQPEHGDSTHHADQQHEDDDDAHLGED